jgi:DNA polymerase III gamma/tau subunit
MIEVYLVTDSGDARREVREKFSDQVIGSFDAESFEESLVNDMLHTPHLMGDRGVVLLTDCARNVDTLKEFVENAIRAPHDLVWIEATLTKPIRTIFEKAEVSIIDKTDVVLEKGAEEKQNSFALADALLQGEKRELWRVLERDLENGKDLQEILGMLMWQLRVIVASREGLTPEESHMAAFPLGKAKRKTPPENLEAMIEELFRVAHFDTQELSQREALEAWVLKWGR